MSALDEYLILKFKKENQKLIKKVENKNLKLTSENFKLGN